MAQVSEATFWLALTLFALLGVVSTIAYSFVGRIRGVVDADKRVLSEKYNAEQAKIRAEIRTQAELSPRQLTEAGKTLQAKQRRLEKQRKRLESATTVLDLRQTVLLPGVLLMVAFSLSSATRALPDPWPYVCAPIAVVLLLATLVLASRRLSALRYQAAHKIDISRTC